MDRDIDFDDSEASVEAIKENEHTNYNDAVLVSHEVDERSLHADHFSNLFVSKIVRLKCATKKKVVMKV